MRFSALALCLVASLAIAQPADAILKHYAVNWTTIAEFNNASPSPNKYPGSPARNRVVIDDAGGGAPILTRLLLVQEFQGSVDLPGGNAFLFINSHLEEEPRKDLRFTGTGDSTTTIAWGLVTGWSVTGGLWCHSSPSFICTYVAPAGANGKDLATVDPVLFSSFYDLGTWTFHGTGFTSVPFVHDTYDAYRIPMGVGNRQYQIKGRLAAGLVPAVPVLGVVLLGVSLLLAGARLSRRR